MNKENSGLSNVRSDDLLCCQQDAKRYRWLRSKFAEGDETYIGEWITSEDELDKYIDEKMAT